MLLPIKNFQKASSHLMEEVPKAKTQRKRFGLTTLQSYKELPARSKQSWTTNTVLCRSSGKTVRPSIVARIETKKEAKAVILSLHLRAEFTNQLSAAHRRNEYQQWTVVWLFNPKRFSQTIVIDRT